MTTLLSRVAEQMYWAARYLERAEDTARIVRSFTELIVDMPRSVMPSWEPLLAIAGKGELFDVEPNERSIVQFLVADLDNPGSVVSSVMQCRDNLRSCREVLPRPAWLVINDLNLNMGASADAIARRSRTRFLDRVLSDAQRFEGIVASMMPRDAAFDFLRLGQAIERADMTTRVIAVRAADLSRSNRRTHEDVQWMGLLRSLSAMQAYHRMSRSPMESESALRFLLHERSFPRSIAGCATELRAAISRLPRPERVLATIDDLDQLLAGVAVGEEDAAGLEGAMDMIQVALVAVHEALIATYVLSPTIAPAVG